MPFHFIVSSADGKVLDVEGGRDKAGTPVIAWPKKMPPARNQLWRMETATNEWFFIVSALDTNLVLDVEGNCSKPGTRVIVYPKKYPPADNQLFCWTENMLRSRLDSNLVLDIAGGDRKLIVYRKHGWPNQCWSMDYCQNTASRRAPSSYPFVADQAPPPYSSINPPISFHYIKCCASSKVLDVEGSKNTSGTAVIAYEKNSPPSPNQWWRIEPNGDGYFFVVSALNPDLVLDVEGNSSSSGARVIVYNRKYPPSPNQLFCWCENMLQSRMSSNLVLDVGYGQNLVVWSKHGGLNQRWAIDHDIY